LQRSRLAACYVLGAAAYAVDLVASAAFDLPSGAVIVWAMALLALPMFVRGMRGAAAR
jgi:zinc/manganese transport system permease protein